MNKVLCILAILLSAIFTGSAQISGELAPESVKIEANPSKGFAYPYFLYVPKALHEKNQKTKMIHKLLVLPNNSGKANDDFSFHEADVQRRIKNNRGIADRLGVAILMPAFPRPGTDWKIYTHALDRDALVTDNKEFTRFDLQLISMIDDARARLAGEDLKFDDAVLMLGFSASAMFVNRFVFLHPKRVAAAVIGSPGGWPIAPVGLYEGSFLRYPVGTGDLKTVSGKNLDTKNLRKVSLFMFLGEKDDNDSVTFRDGYEKEDEDVIFKLFGRSPVERWEKSKKLYQEAKLNAEFRLYPNAAHSITKEMFDDIFVFLTKHSQRNTPR